MKKCPACGHQNLDDDNFCEHCGQSLSAVKNEPATKKDVSQKCPNCGHTNPSGSAFCEQCGHKLTTEKTTSKVVPEAQQPVAPKTTPIHQAPLSKNKPSSESHPITDTSNDSRTHLAPNHNPQKPHRNTWIIVGIIVVLLLVVGIFALHSHNASQSADSTPKVTESTPSSSNSTSSNKSTTTERNQVSASDINNILSNNLDSLAGTTGSYYYNLNDHTTTGILENTKIRAASDIKLFIMATAFQQISEGNLSLSDRYELTDTDKVGGTGIVQSMQTGTSLTYKDLLNYMITQSDNTAANIIVDKVGGLSAVNSEINQLGLDHTDMQRKLMDQDALNEGRDNYTTAKDLGLFLTRLYQHKVVSEKYDKQMLDIMSNDSNHTKLPSRINTDVVTVYNKTGEYDKYGVQNDAAIFKRDNKAFVIVVMSENGEEADQKSAMGDLGAALAKKVFDN